MRSSELDVSGGLPMAAVQGPAVQQALLTHSNESFHTITESADLPLGRGLEYSDQPPSGRSGEARRPRTSFSASSWGRHEPAVSIQAVSRDAVERGREQ